MTKIFLFYVKMYSRNYLTYLYLLSYYSFLSLNLFLIEFQKVSVFLIYPILLAILTLWNEDENFRKLYRITLTSSSQFIFVKSTMFLLLSLVHFFLFYVLLNCEFR